MSLHVQTINSPAEKVYQISRSIEGGEYAIKQQLEDMTFRQFASTFAVPMQGGKQDGHFVRGAPNETEDHVSGNDVHHGKGHFRADRYLPTADFHVLDGDKGNNGPAPPVKAVHDALVALHLNHFIYTSHSHTAEAPRWRAVIEGHVSSKEKLEPMVRKLLDEVNAAGNLDIAFAAENKVWSQAWYLNYRDDPEDGLYEFYEYHDGRPYQYANGQDMSFGDSVMAGMTPTHTYEQYMQDMFDTGTGHTNYAPAAMILLNKGMSCEEVYRHMQPQCVAAFAANNQEWPDWRNNNLWKAIKDGHHKYEISKALAGPAAVVIDTDLQHKIGQLPAYQIAENNRPKRKPTIQLMRMKEIRANLRPTDFLIDDVLQNRTLGQMVAPGGSLKSFLTIDWGLCIASGTPWLDNKVSKQGAVVYLAGEGVDGINKRVEGWCKEHNIDSDIPFVVSDRASALDDVDQLNLLAMEIIEVSRDYNQRIRLIIVDTLARNFGSGDENSTRDMNTFVRSLDELAGNFECTVLVVHHTAKGNATIGRGSVALHNATDTSYLLEYDRPTGLLKVINDRSKDTEDGGVILLKKQVVDIDVPDEPNATTLVLRKANISDQPRSKAIVPLLTVNGLEKYADWIVEGMTAMKNDPQLSRAGLALAVGQTKGIIRYAVDKLRDGEFCQKSKHELTKKGCGYLQLLIDTRGGVDAGSIFGRQNVVVERQPIDPDYDFL